ncbi:MAG: hypothetical protein QUV05_00440 [Phycisphaerae bacterium]|nr:hypothetical protein [Phycisphaerae bacterium]
MSPLELINQMAGEVERDEMELKQLIVSLINEGRTELAIAALELWRSQAAGEVLKKYGNN